MILPKDHEFKNASEAYAWLNLTDDEFQAVVDSGFNPLTNLTEIEIKTPGLREVLIMQNPDYLYFFCKVFLNLEIYPLQSLILQELAKYNFSILLASRGYSKTFSLGVFALIQMILNPGIKIVVVGSAFRQSKFIFNYAEKIWKDSPVLQSIYKSSTDGPRIHTDRAMLTLGRSTLVALPIGNGEKIRGERANIIMADEFNSINLDVYQTVIQNFAAVSADPINNMKKRAYRKILEQTGQWHDSMEEYFQTKSNKSIISGTMGSDWEPLNEYVNKYKAIIKSRGNTDHMKDIFGDDVPESVNWKNFMVATIPVELIPDGFMDSDIVEQGRYTLDLGIYMAEFGCCPISDTNGFYKKSLIDGCTANHKNIAGDYWPEWCPNEFSATVQGARNKRYVFGIDPAHTSDNFAIIILEIHENHSRVVYSWTTNKKAFADQSKTSDENNYFAYCARKIRNLMEKFPCEAIVMDAQGGGRAVEEALRDQDKLLEGELPLWPVIDPDKREETDTKTGLHILHMVNMTQPWNADANYALQKDLYDKIVLFPSFDTIGAGLATELNVSSSDYDRLDDCMLEIEELKKELITIVKSRTPSGKERWDTPDTITGSHALSSKSMNRMRKDRFSALLLANSIARGIKLRNLGNFMSNRNNYSVGVAGGNLYKTNNNRSAYIGNPEITKHIKLSNYRGITR